MIRPRNPAATFVTDAAYLAAAVASSPVWLVRMGRTGKLRTDWPGRMGAAAPWPRPEQGGAGRILIHAVSVGEVNAVRPLVEALQAGGIDYPLLLTYGLSYVLIEAIRVLFGIEGVPTSTPAALRGAVDLGFGYFPLYRLFLIGATAVVVAALWLFLEKTRYGLIVRAGSRDGDICRVLGVDISRVWLMVFGIGCAIAGLSGVLAAPTRAVNPEMGVHVLAESFVVTVVGGMGSLMGAVIAGLLVGIVVAMTSLFAPDMAKVSIFVLMALVLLVRPRGLLGREGALG